MNKNKVKEKNKKIKNINLEYIMSVNVLKNFIEVLSTKYKTYAPVNKEKRVVWAQIKNFNEISRDYIDGIQTTILPPKYFFFPPNEKLLFLNSNNVDYKKNEQIHEPFILFGVHPCDIHGLLLMDKIFLENYVDDFYKEKRDNAIIIGMDTMPNEWNFSKSAGTDIIDSGFDIFLIPLKENKFYIKIATKKGLSLIKNINGLFPLNKNDKKLLTEFYTEKNKRYKRNVDMHDLPKLLDRTYESKIWDEIGKQCVACTRCSIVCPTCYCFNIKEDYYLNLIEGERVRTWDSCLRQNFALVAGGHNFRSSLKARIRHRYYHKERIFSYIYGKSACVGCGRCSRDCKANIKPDEVFNKLRQLEIKS